MMGMAGLLALPEPRALSPCNNKSHESNIESGSRGCSARARSFLCVPGRTLAMEQRKPQDYPSAILLVTLEWGITRRDVSAGEIEWAQILTGFENRGQERNFRLCKN
jgi:hypothetical protein